MPFEKFILSSSYLRGSIGVGGTEEVYPLGEVTGSDLCAWGVAPCDVTFAIGQAEMKQILPGFVRTVFLFG